MSPHINRSSFNRERGADRAASPLRRFARVGLPKIEPVRPVRVKSVPVGREWVYELKLDGFRGVLTIEDGRGRFTSKTSRPMPRFQELADGLARTLRVRDAILDGEIIVMSEGGPDFYALFFRRGEPAYAAFDLLWLNGRDLRALPLWRRKKRLETLVAKSPIAYVEHVDDPALFAATAKQDLEGIVAKKRGDAYGPETHWVKVKHAGYTQMEGRWELFDRRR
jgi:bifunctional non-homologous end joining protein LigD